MILGMIYGCKTNFFVNQTVWSINYFYLYHSAPTHPDCVSKTQGMKVRK